MFEVPHYPEIIKKTIIGFGTLFSNIQVIRRNSDGVVVEMVKVPIAYGPKEKFIQRIDADPTLTQGVYITLPRLAFEITGYSHDTSRATNRNNKIQCKTTDGLTFTYTPVPYNLDISLYLLTKGTEDSLAVLEQILPLFQPEYTLNLRAMPEMLVTTNVPITLQGVSVADDYEGDYATRRLVTHTFNFTAKLMLFGQMHGNGVILRTETNLPGFDLEHISEGDMSTGEVTVDEWTNIQTPPDYGPELILNNRFSMVSTAGWVVSDGDAYLGTIPGYMRIYGQTEEESTASYNVSTVVGKTYRVTASYKLGSSGYSICADIEGLELPYNYGQSDISMTGTFVATATTSVLNIRLSSNPGETPVSAEGLVNYVSVREES